MEATEAGSNRQQLREELVGLALEHDVVSKWADRLKACGMVAEVDWTASEKNVMVVQDSDGVSIEGFCYGKIALQGSAIHRIELHKWNSSSSKTSAMAGKGSTAITEIGYQDHFLIDVSDCEPANKPSARRVPRRGFLGLGRIQKWEWKGGPFGQRLAANHDLNHILDSAGEGKLDVRYQNRPARICIRRHYIGATMEIQSTHNKTAAKIVPHDNLPSIELLRAMEQVAAEALSFAGIPQP